VPGRATNDDLFESGIAIEDLQREFYKILSEKFAHHQEIADFWKGMEDDELHHASLLESIRGSLPYDRIEAKVGPSIILAAYEVLKTTAKERAGSITNLNNAYKLVNDQENSSLNTIYNFLVVGFSRSDDVLRFALAELERHVQKLADFPQTFGDAEWRKSIKIKE
jgi:hypothetical protein